MIKKIKIKNVATFSNETIIDDLKKINFFYGANGSGKTTITRVISKPENFVECEISWENNANLKTIVFNEDFIREYFFEKDKLNGIYTIGEGAKDIEEKIISKKRNREILQNDINTLNGEISDKLEEQKKLYNDFKETCWKYGYLGYKDDFDLFFTGYKNSKEKFTQKILEENSRVSKPLDKIKLKEKYELIYGKEIQRINEINAIETKKIEKIEGNQDILEAIIVGRKDVDISRIIEKLHNHDWVKQGKTFYEQNFDEEKNAYICPFCQQPTTEEFKKQLEEYFDETYNQQMKELKIFLEEYKRITNEIIYNLDQILQVSNKYLEKQKSILKDKKTIIKEIAEKNIQLITNKVDNPSGRVTLKKISDELREINLILDKINEQIIEHNKIVDDKEREKEDLDKNLWKFIIHKLSNYINDYEKNERIKKQELDNLNRQKIEKEEKIKKLDEEILVLEKEIKSVRPTVESINKLLKNFGFEGFQLSATDDDKHYQIVRNDGTDAKTTLSEGERNFIVFLYFYHLIYGAESLTESTTQNKVLIIDDPISSVDSQILFIVSTLIRNLLDRVRKNNDNVKQVFIFTHNAYFYKEITYISSRESCYNKRNDTMYYILRKINNVSFIEKFEKCPIKTSYQLLWDELKKNNIDCISIQNSMRRILEFYFKFLAGLNEVELLNKFDEKEKDICKSLIAWINVGSHEIIDDFFISTSIEELQLYKNVFKRIFEVTGHINHYNMMMGIDTQTD